MTEITPAGSARWPLVVLAGVAASVHIWKLPPMVDPITVEFGVSLVDAGVLLGTVQLAGMIGGLVFGLAAEVIGLRRCMLAGLVLLAAASVAGAFAPTFGVLLALRAVESIGFLLIVVPAPALIRRVTPADRLGVPMGVWASFHAIASVVTLGAAALLADVLTRPAWWLATAAVPALAAIVFALRIPADPPRAGDRAAGAPRARELVGLVRRTVASPGPWAAGIAFAAYAASWMAVIGFLPTVGAAAGLDPTSASLATAAASGVNGIGAVVAGVLLHRGAGSRTLIAIGAVTMGATSFLVFGAGIAAPLAFAAVLLFSAVGGFIPSTLMRRSLDLTPPDGSTPATVGLIQQFSNGGMFIGPPIAAAIATATGSWTMTPALCVVCTGIALVASIGVRVADR